MQLQVISNRAGLKGPVLSSQIPSNKTTGPNVTLTGYLEIEEDPSIVARLSVSLQSDYYLIGSLENQCLDVSFSCPDLSLWHGRSQKKNNQDVF